jgi:Fe-S oxidoreductase
LIGIEPSAILTFRDEYPELADPSLKEDALRLAKNVFLFDEFFVNIPHREDSSLTTLFTKDKQTIKLHGHCQQKAVASMDSTIKMLSIPENFKVDLITSGCCGMAGSFGYEKEHYDLSMKIGELGLFPEVRKADLDTIISAPGTSCRHQIKDGTGRIALHPIEVMFNALI